jgi:predicted CXXCH cytochrome family protein
MGTVPCYQCHHYIKELITNKPGKGRNIHDTLAGFTKSSCTSCHNPHSSPYPYLLEEEPESYRKK